jgi:hypothetical protein
VFSTRNSTEFKMTKTTHGGARKGAGRKPKVHSQLDGTPRLPLEYLLAVMNDPAADPLRRDRMAKAAAPFLHPKAGASGKKNAAHEAAAKAGQGKFKPGMAPKLTLIGNTEKGKKP